MDGPTMEKFMHLFKGKINKKNGCKFDCLFLISTILTFYNPCDFNSIHYLSTNIFYLLKKMRIIFFPEL